MTSNGTTTGTTPTVASGATTAQRTWQVLGSVLTVVLLGAGTFSAVGLLAHDVRTEVSHFPTAAVDTVRVTADDGRIEVRAGDVEQIRVESRISSSLGTTVHRERIVGRTLELHSDCPEFGVWCRVDWTVTVPRDVAVNADTRNGRVLVQGVDGTVTAESRNGGITLGDLGGTVHVTTRNGRVEASALRSDHLDVTNRNGSVTLAFVEPPDHVRVRNRNGGIGVGVPDTAGAYRVDTSTRNGDRRVAVRTDPAGSRVIDLATDNGSVAVVYGLP